MTELKPYGAKRKSVFWNSRNSYPGNVCFMAKSISRSGTSENTFLYLVFFSKTKRLSSNWMNFTN